MTINEWLHIIQHKGLDGITNRVDDTIELVELLEELQSRRNWEKSHYTNRDRFLHKLASMSNRELADLYCRNKNCCDCQFVYKTGCFNKLAERFKQEVNTNEKL